MGKTDETKKILKDLSASSDSGDSYSCVPPGYKLGRTKYIVITGSVISGLGKGIFSASLAKLLQNHGYKCNMIKMDGYFNEDAGTLSPFRHGEVFVLDDGTECDMDLGTYERFTNQSFSKLNIFTNGRLNKRLNELERKGHFHGGDVQFYPHVTGELIKFVRESSMHYGSDFTLVEIGGTVGDEENRAYITAMSDLAYKEGRENIFFINLVWIIEASHLNEQKSKAAQHGTQLLMQLGIQPDMIACRAENPVEHKLREKLADRLRVQKDNVIDVHNLKTIYHVPAHLADQKVDSIILDHFKLKQRNNRDKEWDNYLNNFLNPKKEIVIGLTGKYNGPRDTYASIHNAIEHAATKFGVKARVYDIRTDSIEEGKTNVEEEMKKVDGIIVPGGFGKRGAEGKIACIKYARENKIPYLGICYGFQMAAIEFARDVCGIKDANTTENVPDTKNPLICLLPEQYKIEGIGGNMRLGGREVEIKKGTLANSLYNSAKAMERFRHRYEFNPDYRAQLEKKGLVFSGWAPNQPIMQILELPNLVHPYFIGVQYHPEFTSRPLSPNPLFLGLIKACLGGK